MTCGSHIMSKYQNRCLYCKNTLGITRRQDNERFYSDIQGISYTRRVKDNIKYLSIKNSIDENTVYEHFKITRGFKFNRLNLTDSLMQEIADYFGEDPFEMAFVDLSLPIECRMLSQYEWRHYILIKLLEEVNSGEYSNWEIARESTNFRAHYYKQISLIYHGNGYDVEICWGDQYDDKKKQDKSALPSGAFCFNQSVTVQGNQKYDNKHFLSHDDTHVILSEKVLQFYGVGYDSWYEQKKNVHYRSIETHGGTKSRDNNKAFNELMELLLDMRENAEKGLCDEKL
jgi:hypothetical protein